MSAKRSPHHRAPRAAPSSFLLAAAASVPAGHFSRKSPRPRKRPRLIGAAGPPLAAKKPPLQILLVEDCLSDAQLVRTMLKEVETHRYEITHVERMSAALPRLIENHFDVVLLDLALPDSHHLNTISEVRAAAPDLPIVVLTGLHDETLATQSVQMGAEDHLLKDEINGQSLMRAIRYAIERKRAELRVSHFAYYDNLTELPNRTLLYERLRHALLQKERHDQTVAVLFLDLDRFKPINDALGHACGDLLLQTIARRLTTCVRKSDTVARFAGDEFVAILTELSGAAEAAKVAQKMLELLADPIQLEGREVAVTASIGISLCPGDAQDAEGMIRNADAAMYRAKEAHGNSYEFYTEELNAKAMARLLLENDLRKALGSEQLLLRYQPQFDLASDTITSVEALVRWQHPDLGVMPPTGFIPLAEATGLILPLGEWVLRRACTQNRSWQTAGLRPVRIAVNLSPRQFWQDDFVDVVANVLQDTGLDPQYLELELTESTLVKDVPATTSRLRRLSALGVLLSVDASQTGFSSLNYLREFPVACLKIGQTFVRDVHTDPDHGAIVVAIIAMAHFLKLKVTAVGVENPEQLAFLRQHHCDRIQGYHSSPPVAPEAIVEMLR